MATANEEALLKAMVAWDQEPALSQEIINALLDRAAMADEDGNAPSNVLDVASPWAAGTVEPGAVVYDGAGRYWRCIVPGATGPTEPSWSNLGGTPFRTRVADGDAVWLDVGTHWAGSFGLELAAAEGWRIKAGYAANRFGFMTDGQQFSRQQIHAMCLAMAQIYERRCACTIRVVRADA